MPRYICPYVSDGVKRSLAVRASSANEAAKKMADLPWAPGCGPSGLPRPDFAGLLNEKMAPAVVALAIAASALLLGTLNEKPQVLALFDDLHRGERVLIGHHLGAHEKSPAQHKSINI